MHTWSDLHHKQEQEEYSDSESSSSPAFTPVTVVPVCQCRFHYQCPSCTRRRLKHDSDEPEAGATAVDENADAAPPAGCQRDSEAAAQPEAPPPARRRASPLREVGNTELQRKVNGRRETTHH